MRIIFTYQDLKVLRQANAIPQALLELVQDYLNQLRIELEDKAKSEFIPSARNYKKTCPLFMIRYSTLSVTASFKAILLGTAFFHCIELASQALDLK
ncbi:hypothetical protein [Paenibacillus sp. PDC88]|uniref:hypothetical protein n=1 Tax=Paenibacillus sp. PDC88 TaxID=1884375 RepID=UPI00089D7380|nr:hypothetical protein [Paenibacillus sp. PDC88]SDW35406.1 hypothetical protein SAMN05518848_1011127 [Paenibacillus sp. PDC88]